VVVTGTSDGEERWLQEAVDAAVANVEAGGGPFGALVVRDGVALGRGTNRVTADLDPTAHAEVLAIRAACRSVGDFRLDGAVVYASCEPCPLCLAACLWARVDGVVYGADRDDAAAAGFDDRAFHELLCRPTGEWPISVRRGTPLDHTAPFRAWHAHPDRVAY
jgi:guanine deaminase